MVVAIPRPLTHGTENGLLGDHPRREDHCSQLSALKEQLLQRTACQEKVVIREDRSNTESHITSWTDSGWHVSPVRLRRLDAPFFEHKDHDNDKHSPKMGLT